MKRFECFKLPGGGCVEGRYVEMSLQGELLYCFSLFLFSPTLHLRNDVLLREPCETFKMIRCVSDRRMISLYQTRAPKMSRKIVLEKKLKGERDVTHLEEPRRTNSSSYVSDDVV